MIRPVCAMCHSTDIFISTSTVVWNQTRQCWVLDNVDDCGRLCSDCDKEVQFIWLDEAGTITIPPRDYGCFEYETPKPVTKPASPRKLNLIIAIVLFILAILFYFFIVVTHIDQRF